MPLFEYKCEGCGLRFEELVNRKDSKDSIECKKCGAEAKKVISRFSSVIPGGSSTEPVDMTIGREANKRWQSYHDRQSKRREPFKMQTFDLPRGKDGKSQPIMKMGDAGHVKQRTEFVGALQEHRQKRKEKGIPQFSGPGEF